MSDQRTKIENMKKKNNQVMKMKMRMKIKIKIKIKMKIKNKMYESIEVAQEMMMCVLIGQLGGICSCYVISMTSSVFIFLLLYRRNLNEYFNSKNDNLNFL